MVGWILGIIRYNGYIHLFHNRLNSPTFLPLNVLEKINIVEQFHGQYIVIRIQVVQGKGFELEHVHSIIVKVGDKRAQFNVDGILENLSSTAQVELANLFQFKF
jgi:hypothetical protein